MAAGGEGSGVHRKRCLFCVAEGRRSRKNVQNVL